MESCIVWGPKLSVKPHFKTLHSLLFVNTSPSFLSSFISDLRNKSYFRPQECSVHVLFKYNLYSKSVSCFSFEYVIFYLASILLY